MFLKNYLRSTQGCQILKLLPETSFFNFSQMVVDFFLKMTPQRNQEMIIERNDLKITHQNTKKQELHRNSTWTFSITSGFLNTDIKSNFT